MLGPTTVHSTIYSSSAIIVYTSVVPSGSTAAAPNEQLTTITITTSKYMYTTHHY